MEKSPDSDRPGNDIPPQDICRAAMRIAEVLADADGWKLSFNYFEKHQKQWMLMREQPSLMRQEPFLSLRIFHDVDENTWRLDAGWVETFWMTDEELKYVFDAAEPLIDKCLKEFGNPKTRRG